jgi:porin
MYISKQGCIGTLVLLYSISANAEISLKDNFKFTANFIDLAMYSQESNVDDNFTNSAGLFLNTEIKLANESQDFGVLKAQYVFNGLNDDAQLNTSNNWFGGVGSYVGGAIAANDLASSQLSLLTWDKYWSDKKLYTSVGRTNLRRYFLYNNCQNILLCTDPIKGAMGSLPTNYAYWGGYAKYNLSDHIYMHAGVFEVNTDDYVYKKKGLDFSFHHQLGYTQVYGVGYKDKNSKAELLYFYNNSEYRNAYTQEKYDGTDGLNFRFNHDFNNQNIPTVFGAYSYIDEKNQPYKNYWELGLSYKINQGKNHLGVKFGQSQLNNDYVLMTEKINGNNNKTTSFLSLDTDINYKRLTLSPFVQYIWNPDNYYRSTGKAFNSNVIVGLVTQIKLY